MNNDAEPTTDASSIPQPARRSSRRTLALMAAAAATTAAVGLLATTAGADVGVDQEPGGLFGGAAYTTAVDGNDDEARFASPSIESSPDVGESYVMPSPDGWDGCPACGLG